MLSKQSFLILFTFLCILITFDAFQQKFYVDTFDLSGQVQPLSTFLRLHFIRWSSWLVFSVPFAVILWKVYAGGIRIIRLKQVLALIILSTFFITLSIITISLISIYEQDIVFTQKVFLEFCTFFFYQKWLTFFMAHGGLVLWLNNLKHINKIDAQWVEIVELKKVKEEIPTREEPKITVKIGNLVKPLSLQDISWIQADDYCVKIHTNDKSYYLRKSLKFLEKELAQYRFVRVHRGALLNLNYLEKINFDSATVTLQNRTQIPVSRTGEQILRKRIKEESL